MKPNSRRTRAVIFAYLFGPPRIVEREEASNVHGRICDALGYDDFSFKYSSPGATPGSSAKAFSILLERAEGRGGLKIALDGGGTQNPVRLLVEYIWPPSVQHVNEQLDRVAEAVFGALQGDWKKVLAEARLRTECDVDGNNASRYMRDEVLRLDEATVQSLQTPISFASVKLETPPSPPVADDPFAGPKREMTLEVLRENPKCLYVETMCQWDQLGAAPIGGQIQLNLTQIRPIQDKPSEYVEKAYEFLDKKFFRLWGGSNEADA